MAFKTIVVLVSESDSTDSCVNVAARIAKCEDAHLIGVAITGVTRFMEDTVAMDQHDSQIAPFLDILRKRASRSLARFTAVVGKAGVKSMETRMLDDPFAKERGLAGVCSDLLILQQSNPDEADSMTSELASNMLIRSACPILMLPYKERCEKIGSDVLIAWDGSRESQRAIRDAIPLLQKAASVQLVIFNHGLRANETHRQALADVQAYLLRHDARVNVSERSTDGDVGEALLLQMRSMHSNLLVMGCYGHSRFRELVLGGVTRTILKQMSGPVLLSH